MEDYEEIDVETAPESDTQQPVDESTKKLVLKLTALIKDDKKYFADSFKRMRKDMYVATYGCEEEWGKDRYVANIIGNHISHKTDRLYAKNPKAVAKRRETLDFAMWDENPDTLKMAMEFVSSQTAMMQSMPQEIDPMTGSVVPSQPIPSPEFQQAQAIVQDAQAGIEKQKTLKKFGQTLEILFAQALRQQNPVDFKTAMKQLVRRTCTTAVGYIDVGFQRAYGLRLEAQNKLADAKMRLEHLQSLQTDVDEGEITPPDAEIAELQAAIAGLESEQDVLLREGLVFDFPPSTRVIPDKMCKHLVGWIGARHLTVEYLYTSQQVKEVFGVDLENKYTSYRLDGDKDSDDRSRNYVYDNDDYGEDDLNQNPSQKKGLVCVWKHFDKPSGLVYYLADGYKDFLRPPAPPDVKIDDFFTIRALTFNAVENEELLFPPSDVALLLPMQKEINRSREAQREHRKAARPRWGYSNGALSEDDIEQLTRCDPLSAIALSFDPSVKISDILQPIPISGVDPNLYETNPYFTDMTMVAGAQASQLGAADRGTATAAAISADAGATATSSGVDDLDSFLTWVARSSSQILLREMSPEKVQEIVGVGAVWAGIGDIPPLDMGVIAEELYLDIEAGSSGKPNRALEIQTWKEMLPFLIQMGSIPSDWLARETLRRADDRMDLTEAVVAGIPSILAQNRMQQMGTGDPSTDPNQQGDKGGDKAPAPRGSGGSGAPMGNNQE